MSGDAEWQGHSFPYERLNTAPDVTTMEIKVHFFKDAAAGTVQGVAWPQGHEVGGPFAARVTGVACSSVRVWQQLSLEATPGTELRLDGIPVAVTEAASFVHRYPRGPARHATYVHWVEPGCVSLELLMFEPPLCLPGHIEELTSDSTPLAEVSQIQMSYMHGLVMMCKTADCNATVEVRLLDAVQLCFRVVWSGVELTQEITRVYSNGTTEHAAAWVRSCQALNMAVSTKSMPGLLAYCLAIGEERTENHDQSVTSGFTTHRQSCIASADYGLEH
jgi:hypothetical protein